MRQSLSISHLRYNSYLSKVKLVMWPHSGNNVIVEVQAAGVKDVRFQLPVSYSAIVDFVSLT